MKNNVFIGIVLSLMVLCIYSCSKPIPDCIKIKEAVLADDEQTLRNEINKLCANFTPKIAIGDDYGQKANFSTLAENIKGNCDIETSEVCYLCLAAEPPVSTFRISFIEDTSIITKTVEISLSPYNRLQYKSIRD